MASPSEPTSTSNAASNAASSSSAASPAAAGSSSSSSSPPATKTTTHPSVSSSYSGGRRFGSIIRLRPECVAAYKECHANCWPEVQKQITDCHIHDCALPPPPPHIDCSSCSPAIMSLTLISVHRRGPTRADVIYHDPETGLLFSSFKYSGSDFERDMALMRENPRVREWWSMTDSYQEASLLGACLYIPAIEEVGNFVAGTDSASVIGFGLAPTELGPRSAKQRSRRAVMVETNRRGLLSSMMRPVATGGPLRSSSLL